MIRHGRHALSRSAGPSVWRVLTAMLAGVAAVFSLVVLQAPAQAAVGVPVTFDDFSYATTVNRPTENKPQSKLTPHHHGSRGSATTLRASPTAWTPVSLSAS
jgi:hypothetical protein